MGFDDTIRDTEQEMEQGAFFKFKEDGKYAFRILTEPEFKSSVFGVGICYEDAPYCKKEWLEAHTDKNGEPAKLGKKWDCYAIKRGDVKKEIPDVIVYLSMSYKIAKQIIDLKRSEDYAFGAFPMPYDITVDVTNAGETKVVYSVQARKKETPVTEEELAALGKLTPVKMRLDREKARAKREQEGIVGEGIKYPEESIDPSDIPF